jgi:hypothetical protein
VNNSKGQLKCLIEEHFVCDEDKRVFDEAHLANDWEVW